MAVINIRVNDEVKKEAETIFKSLGLNMSVAMNLFLKKCISENGIPFDLSVELEAKNSKNGTLKLGILFLRDKDNKVTNKVYSAYVGIY